MAKKKDTFDINKLVTEGKVPPQALEVEKAVLGAMLLDRSAVARALEILEEEVFYSEAHRKIFQVMVGLFQKGTPIDLITVTEALQSKQWLDSVGGPYYVSELSQAVSTSANVEAHGHILLEKAILRGIIAASSEAVTTAFAGSDDALTLLDRAESRIFELSEHRMKKTAIDMHTAVIQVMKKLDSIHEKHDGITGVPSGFDDLDKLTGGFQNSDLVIVAGRPSQGKTAFALNVARNAALDSKKQTAVAFFSLEMSTEQLVLRLLSSESFVDQNLLRRGKLPNDDWKLVTRAVGRLADAKIFIDDSPSMTVLELRAKSRRLKAEHNIGMVVIDYLQLIHSAERFDSREREISLISRSLKALAKELNIPVIALSQLNRGIEARTGDNKRPQLSDLRESGAIEQDADVVIFVHRPETYKITSVKDKQGIEQPSEGMAEIIVGKQRNGPTDDLLLRFEKRWMSFKNLDSIHAYQGSPAPSPMKDVEGETPF